MKTLLKTHFYVIFGLLGALSLVFSYLLGTRSPSGGERPAVVVSCSPEVLSSLRVPVAAYASGQKPLQKPRGGKYVGSKHGTKYYIPDCSGAKRIKPENYVWFLTEDDAKLQGYTPGTC